MLGFPYLLPVRAIQRHDMTVQLGREHLAIGHRDAARLLAAADWHSRVWSE